MATITGQSIVDRSETILQDITNTRWPADELFDWLNDGQREVVMLKPDVNTTTKEDFSPTADATLQSIPSAGLMLIDVTRNRYGSGTKAAVRRIDRQILDDQRNTWHGEASVDDVKHWMFDERNPKDFYLYPAPSSNTVLEIVYASAPNDVAPGSVSAFTSKTYSLNDYCTDSGGNYVYKCLLGGAATVEPSGTTFGQAEVDTDSVIWQNVGNGVISIDDIYANALLDYILYRAYQKDADYAANNQRAMTAYESFLNSLGLRDRKESGRDPNVQPTYLSGAVKPGVSG